MPSIDVGREPGVTDGDPDPPRCRQQPEGADELGVELADRDETGGIGRRRGGLAPGGERGGQLAAGQRVGGPERRRIVAEDRERRDGRDLGVGPRGLGRRATGATWTTAVDGSAGRSRVRGAGGAQRHEHGRGEGQELASYFVYRRLRDALERLGE